MLILSYVLTDALVFTRAKSFDRWITSREDLFNVSLEFFFSFERHRISQPAKTGKELLKPELPLCIRLIGLRVTKLKDLRISADTGIKRVR